LLCVVAAVFVVLTGVQRPSAVLGLVGLAAVAPGVATVRGGAKGRDLIAVLGTTGRAQMLFGLAFGLGLLIGA
jgi:1,4-dihydroxy-2-naphthoate octaprenyltransferase